MKEFECNNCKSLIRIKWYQLYRLFRKHEINLHCDKCGYKSNYKLIFHVIRDNTVSFEENKMLNSKRKEVYYNG